MRRLSARLGIITGTPAAFGPAGDLMINHSIGRLLEALFDAEPCARLCLPILPAPNANMNHALRMSDRPLVALPPLASTISAQRYAIEVRRLLRSFADSVDLLFVRLPFQVPRTLLGLEKPKLLHIVSNPAA